MQITITKHNANLDKILTFLRI